MRIVCHTIPQLVEQINLYRDTGVLEPQQAIITEKVIKWELRLDQITNVDVMYALLDGLDTLVNFDGYDPQVDKLKLQADDVFFKMIGIDDEEEE